MVLWVHFFRLIRILLATPVFLHRPPLSTLYGCVIAPTLTRAGRLPSARAAADGKQIRAAAGHTKAINRVIYHGK
jgi:hypothetical protein